MKSSLKTNVSEQFNWVRKGLVYTPDGSQAWRKTHVQHPTVLPLKDRLRVYFNCRPEKGADGNVSAYPTFLDLDINDPSKVLYVHDKPILELGGPGTFDEHGIMISGVLHVGDEVWLYFVGWSRCVGVPYTHAIGLAISKDNGVTFTRVGKGPIIGWAPNEPFLQNSPCVMKMGAQFHMWYSTGTEWIADHGKMEAIYVITHATSDDGINNWQREGVPCIEQGPELECTANPTVIKLGNRYHMWFCYRPGLNFRKDPARGYRIGYAWSDDLKNWQRDDAKGGLMPVKENSWESKTTCYPFAIELNGKVLMFYNGNDFGEGGFGYAVLDKKEIA